MGEGDVKPILLTRGRLLGGLLAGAVLPVAPCRAEGGLEEVRAAIRKVSDATRTVPSAYERTLAVSAVGWAQAKAEAPEEAKVTFARALRMAAGAPGEGHPEELTEQVRRDQVAAGLIPREPPVVCGSVIPSERAWFLAQSGDIAGAKRVAREIPNFLEYIRVEAWLGIAETQLQNGDGAGARASLEEILRLTPEIKESDARSTGFYTSYDPTVRLLRALVAAGDADAAVALTETARNERARARLFAVVAKAQAKRGDVRGARETLGRVPSGSERRGAYTALAIAEAEAGDFRGALETAARIADEPPRVYALARIGRAQARAKDATGAAETFRAAREIARAAARRVVNDAPLIEMPLSGVGVYQAWSGDLPGALETAGEVRNVALRARTLGGIALALRGEDPFRERHWFFWVPAEYAPPVTLKDLR